MIGQSPGFACGTIRRLIRDGHRGRTGVCVPRCAPALAPAGSVASSQQLMQQEAAFSDPADGDPWPEGGDVSDRGVDEGSSATSPPDIRPPP